MDQLMVDCGDRDVRVGDEVTLIGEPPGYGKPDATPGTGDDGHSVGEAVSHARDVICEM